MCCHRSRSFVIWLTVAVSLIACEDSTAHVGPEHPPSEPPPVVTVAAAVVIVPESLSLAVGDSARLVASAIDAVGRPLPDAPIAWASSDTAHASVSAVGLVHALDSGVTTISALSGDVGASAVVTAIAPPVAPPPPPPLPIGDSVDFRRIAAGVRPRGFGQGPYALLAPVADGRALFVAADGSDAAAGTSAAPFRTIARAAQVARAGDVVTIGSGTYEGSVIVANSGTEAAPIVFQAAQRGGVVLTGGNASFRPATWSGGTQQTGQLYVTVRGLIFRRYAANVVASPGPNFPAALKASRGWRVEDCLFDDAGNTAIQIFGSYVAVVKTTIQYSYMEALAAWSHSAATTVGDSRYTPLDGIRIIDVVLRGNHALNRVQRAEAADYSSKFLTTRGAVLDNVEAYENNGPGFWFDTQNSNFTVRNSYFHDNRNIAGTPFAGRGLNIEANWAPGLIERNVFADNGQLGLAITNSQGITIRQNLFVGNPRCIELTNTDRGPSFVLRDIEMAGNWCKGWTNFAAIQTLGDFSTPSLMNIRADGNVYDPGPVARLAWWENKTIGAAESMAELRLKYGWEASGRVERIFWP